MAAPRCGDGGWLLWSVSRGWLLWDGVAFVNYYGMRPARQGGAAQEGCWGPSPPQGRERAERREDGSAGTHQARAEGRRRWGPWLPTSRGFYRNPRPRRRDGEAAAGRSRLREPAGFCSLAKQILFATELRKGGGGGKHTGLQSGAPEHPNDLRPGRRLDIGHKCYLFLREKTCGASPSVAKLGAGSFTFGKGARAWHKARPVPE